MLPRVILYNAVSLDGRFDWLAADIGRFYTLVSRWKEDATLVGSETVLAAPDAVPEETEEAFEPPKIALSDRRPLLVVADSRGRVRTWHYLKKQPYWKSGVALCSRATPKDHVEYLKKRHIDCIVAGEDHVDLRKALEVLYRRYHVRVVRVDSGGTLNGVLLRMGLVDEVSLLVHPVLVGGTTPRSFFRAPDLTSPAGVIRLTLKGVQKLKGGLIWLRYAVCAASSRRKQG